MLVLLFLLYDLGPLPKRCTSPAQSHRKPLHQQEMPLSSASGASRRLPYLFFLSPSSFPSALFVPLLFFVRALTLLSAPALLVVRFPAAVKVCFLNWTVAKSAVDVTFATCSLCRFTGQAAVPRSLNRSRSGQRWRRGTKRRKRSGGGRRGQGEERTRSTALGG